MYVATFPHYQFVCHVPQFLPRSSQSRDALDLVVVDTSGSEDVWVNESLPRLGIACFDSNEAYYRLQAHKYPVGKLGCAIQAFWILVVMNVVWDVSREKKLFKLGNDAGGWGGLLGSSVSVMVLIYCYKALFRNKQKKICWSRYLDID